MIRRLSSRTHHNVLFVVFFIVASACLHFKSFDKLPAKVHVWAQCDHYSLALGFLNNGFNFFKPTTYSLNQQFPPNTEPTNPQGITAVDFPVLHYIVAMAMNLFNSSQPWVFRIVMFIWSFVAIWFLFRTIKAINGFWPSLFISGFIMFQPIYCFYQNGFHVSAAAFNTFLIGCCYLVKYFHYLKPRFFIWGVGLLTLAALMRFTQIISLIALLCTYSVLTYRNKAEFKKLLIVAFGILVVLCYFVYNKQLASSYGTVFLGSPITAKSITSLFNHLLIIAVSYLRGFLPFIHLFAIGGLTYLFIQQKIKPNEKFKTIRIWFLFSVLGTILFTLLMSWSLSMHDYYSLDTWLPVLTIWLIILILNFDSNIYQKGVVAVVVLLFLVGSFAVAFEVQLKRYNLETLSGPDKLLADFSESAEFLNSHSLKNDKVLIICDYGWNTPMIGWKRAAYRVAWKFSETIPIELNKKYDLIVTHNASFSEVVTSNCPTFLSKVDSVASNGLVTIWKQKMYTKTSGQ